MAKKKKARGRPPIDNPRKIRPIRMTDEEWGYVNSVLEAARKHHPGLTASDIVRAGMMKEARRLEKKYGSQ